MNDTPKILIADDHELSAKGLQLMLANEGLDVLPPVGTGIAAIALARQTQPTLAVLDYDMPGANGLEALTDIRRWSPETRVAILTGRTSDSLLHSLIEAGADGLFLKTTAPKDLCDGLLRVIAGAQIYDIAPAAVGEALSRRELQILECIARGLTNSAIGEDLSISAKTVESHRANLMRKLDVHSSASLIVQAVKRGLISI